MKIGNKRYGISLITLVITIVVIIILTGAIILSISNNNPIKQAAEAVLRQDIATMKEKHMIIYIEELGKNKGNHSAIDDNAFNEVVPEKYKPDFSADKDGVHYHGDDETIKEIIKDIGGIDINGNPQILDMQLSSLSDSIIVDVLYIADDVKNIKYSISEDGISWKDYNSTKSSYRINGLSKSTNYKVKIEITYGTDQKLESTVKEITTKDIVQPQFGSISNEWTNQDISLTINYPETTDLRYQYSFTGNDSDWVTVTNSTYILTVTENKTVYARCLDASNNESGVATIVINKIDKAGPVINSVTSGDITQDSLSVVVTAKDEGIGTVIKYKYSIDGTSYTETTSNTYTFTGLTYSKTYDVYVIAIDGLGNESESARYPFTTAAYECSGVGVPTPQAMLSVQDLTPSYNDCQACGNTQCKMNIYSNVTASEGIRYYTGWVCTRCGRLYYNTKGTPYAPETDPDKTYVPGCSRSHWHPETAEGCKYDKTYCDGINLPTYDQMLACTTTTNNRSNHDYCGGVNTKINIYCNDTGGYYCGWVCTNCHRRYYQTSTEPFYPMGFTNAHVSGANMPGFATIHYHEDNDQGCK